MFRKAGGLSGEERANTSVDGECSSAP
jgi:hypothetical protein